MKRAASAPSAEELWHAVARSEDDLVAELLALGADANATGLKPHPLVMAARRNSLRVMRLLLDARANPNGGGSSADFVPLSECQSREAVALLVRAGADVNVANSMGNTPLHVLAARGDTMVSVLREVSLPSTAPRWTPSHAPAQIVSAGADVNSQSSTGASPLSCCFAAPGAIWEANAECLLQAGARVDSDRTSHTFMSRTQETITEEIHNRKSLLRTQSIRVHSLNTC